MEDFEKAQPIWQVQVELAKKVLDVNKTLSLIESGLIDFRAGSESVQGVLDEFLTTLFELEMVFYPELSSDSNYRGVLLAIETYRQDKQAYAQNYPVLIFATYSKSAMSAPRLQVHFSLEEMREFQSRNPNYELVEMKIYPGLDVLVAFARAILDVALRMDLLRIAGLKRPSKLFHEVVEDELS